MARTPVRLLGERAYRQDQSATAAGARALPVRTVTVNVTESPLGWLLAHGHVTRRQFDAGERLRSDWERAQLAPRVTMSWDAAPVRSEEHTSELQSQSNLVCRLLLEKKKNEKRNDVDVLERRSTGHRI